MANDYCKISRFFAKGSAAYPSPRLMMPANDNQEEL